MINHFYKTLDMFDLKANIKTIIKNENDTQSEEHEEDRVFLEYM
jgi:hypothetical protein